MVAAYSQPPVPGPYKTGLPCIVAMKAKIYISFSLSCPFHTYSSSLERDRVKRREERGGEELCCITLPNILAR